MIRSTFCALRKTVSFVNHSSPRIIPAFNYQAKQFSLINGRWFSGQPSQTKGELYLINKLKERIPDSSAVEVKDVSGGCGEMYEVYVVSPSFKGKSILQQHKMVTEALKEDIPQFHGIRVETSSS
ncbi:bolA-like protein 3 [Tetranychus urticae]|uniref:BolA-like protein 3 n=1 Tax=Tetranychus urticae TaxID=32264 RepID=T1K4Z2_TETUR|nr:bolA-like protein 3 [Tetranychus urticae]